MDIKELLDIAGKTISERGQQYDATGQERNMGKIVGMFNQLHGTQLTEAQGWSFMELLKMVRFFSNTQTPHMDSVIDQIAYSALRGECASKKEA